MAKTQKVILIIAGILVFSLTVFLALVGYFADFKWFQALGYESVFMTILKTRVFIWLVSFMIFFIITYVNLRLLKTITADKLVINPIWDKIFKIGVAIISAIIAFLSASVVYNILWEEYLKFINWVSFGISDPIFNLDIGYYMFRRPFLYGALQILTNYILLMTVVTLLAYYGTRALFNNRGARIHTGILISIFLVLTAIAYHFKAQGLVHSVRGEVFGAGYTDVLVTLPYYRIQMGIVILAAVLTLVNAFKRRFSPLIISGVVLFFATSILGNIVAGVVQQFIVLPNEIVKETEYIKHNIEYTNKAFGLDKIVVEPFEDNDTLTQGMLERNDEIVNNIRINDYRAALITYNQLQGIRRYYRFNDIDTDRYIIDGKKTQVFLSAREMDKRQTTSTFVNDVFKFTHGMGIAMNRVNEVNSQGQPVFIINNIPPQTRIEELELEQPRIYYGELTNDYVIVNANIKEFDYPSGDKNVESTYTGTGGVPMAGINKLIYAIDKGNFRLFVSNYVTSDSRIMINRNIIERVKKIAPFIILDKDPYIALADGKLVWIIDGYMQGSQYPYSEPVFINNMPVNYIRNSVKITVDAYNGNVDFYIADEDDPMIQVYSKIFPKMFKNMSDMSDSIKQHIRYPEYMFEIQSDRYKKYHMTDITVFYNEEDLWEFGREKFYNDTRVVEPYYSITKLPGEDEAEFILMRPFTPVNKDNAIAWMSARCDGDNYGQLLVYRFPKDKLVYGPAQIEAFIDQHPVISRELSLWDQRGSSVIRGNLLVIPIEDTLLYVEPLFIQSDTDNALPEMKQVIVAYKDRLVMDESLSKALGRLFVDRPDEREEAPGLDGQVNLEDLINRASNLFEEAKQFSGEGNWTGFGIKMQELEDVLRTLGERVE